MLEVRGIVDTGGQHDHRRVLDATRGGCPQRLQQLVRVVPHRPHPHRHEQLGEGLGHDAAVGDHVADAAGHPHVVLEHAPSALLVTDQVDAGDLDAHAVGRLDAGRLAVEVRRAGDQPGRDDAVLDRVLRTVDVGEEGLEGAHALLDARLDLDPLGLVDHARHGVERERPLLAREVEGDTLGQIRAGEGIGAAAQLGLSHLSEGRVNLLVGGAGGARRREHLVPRRRAWSRGGGGAIAIEQVSHGMSLRLSCCGGVSPR